MTTRESLTTCRILRATCFTLAAIVLTAALPCTAHAQRTRTTLVKYDDNKADGRKSIAGTGEMIRFTLPEGATKVRALKIHGSRYGHPQAPKEDFEITFVSDDLQEILHTETAPYALFKRGSAKWVRVTLDQAVELPETFWVVVNFNAERTKGVYLSYDTSTGGKYSRIGLAGDEDQPRETDFGGDWMIQLLAAK